MNFGFITKHIWIKTFENKNNSQVIYYTINGLLRTNKVILFLCFHENNNKKINCYLHSTILKFNISNVCYTEINIPYTNLYKIEILPSNTAIISNNNNDINDKFCFNSYKLFTPAIFHNIFKESDFIKETFKYSYIKSLYVIQNITEKKRKN